MEDAKFVTRGAIAAVDFLLAGWLWWVGGAEGVGEGEEDDVQCEAAVAGAAAGLSLGCWGCHVVR